MKEDNGTTVKAPYMPYTTFKKFISGLKAGAIPSRIDKTLMGGQSGSMQSWTLAALKFFELIDENGIPQDNLALIVESEGEARRTAWKKVFERAYAPIIQGLDLERATVGQLNERFGEDFSLETVRKCHSFFAAGAEDAGIALADHLKPRARGTISRRLRKARTQQKSDVGSLDNNEHDGLGGARSTAATLLLDRNGTRKVVLNAPPTISKAELDRIQKWLSFQLIVEDDE